MRRPQRRRLIATKRQKAQATTKTRGKTRTQVATVTTKKALPVNDEYKDGKKGLRQVQMVAQKGKNSFKSTVKVVI